MPILPKLQSSMNLNSFFFFLVAKGSLIFQFIWKFKGLGITKNFAKEKESLGALMLDFKTYKDTIIKAVWHQHNIGKW